MIYLLPSDRKILGFTHIRICQLQHSSVQLQVKIKVKQVYYLYSSI